MYHYSARQVRVIDGDTVDVEIDLGFSTFVKQRLRLYGINAPEKNRAASRGAGIAALQHLESLLCAGPCEVVTKKDATEKYGRYLAELFVNGENLNDRMVKDGFAAPYMLD